jgi:hypothetical protein
MAQEYPLDRNSTRPKPRRARKRVRRLAPTSAISNAARHRPRRNDCRLTVLSPKRAGLFLRNTHHEHAALGWPLAGRIAAEPLVVTVPSSIQRS